MDDQLNHQAPGSFEIEVFPDRGRVIVAPRGDLDLATAERVRECFNELEGVGFHSIVLDLRKVTFIDSTGVALVVKELNKKGIDLALIPGPSQVQRTFEITGLLERIPFVPATTR